MADKRVILIILDGTGCGELPDADRYGDVGSNTLGNMAKALGGLQLPHLQKLGLGNIIEIAGVPPADQPEAAFGKMAELSPGKDTTTGHWEMAGIILEKAFPTFPQGFPPEVIARFEEIIGQKTIGNVVASGTEIIQVLGEEHLRTGCPIVYTSADSVFQIAAHEEAMPLARLYEICGQARAMLTGEHAVGRVIARPFAGQPGNFYRTTNRHDFSLQPPGETLLDLIKKNGQEVVAVGKISDVFTGKGVTRVMKSKNNQEGIEATLQAMDEVAQGLIFTNLVDFDMLYGHRNDVQGYAQALAEFDASLEKFQAKVRPGDLLIISADHGNDPTTPSTDHAREHVPILIYGPPVQHKTNLGTRRSFADLGATIAEYLGSAPLPVGTSMLAELMDSREG